MSKRCKYTAEEKYGILKAYEDGIGSMLEMVSMYQIDRRTFKEWQFL